MIALKGKSDIGDKINTQIIQPLIDANSRLARSDFPDFNDPNKLGEGKAMVDHLSNQIGIFQKPELDFSSNRADLQSKLVSLSKEQVTEAAAATMELIPRGIFLMSFKLSIGRLCFADCDLFINGAICSLNSFTANADYPYYALERVDFSFYGKQAIKGYTLNKKSLKTVKVRLPTAAEQAAIATVFSEMDVELSALESRRDKTRNIKQAMVQELLTGQRGLI